MPVQLLRKKRRQKRRRKIVIIISIVAVFLVASSIIYFFLPKTNSDTASSTENLSNSTTNSTEETSPTSGSNTTKKSEIVCLDPGHGGSDTGAEYKNITEADINLIVVKQLKTLLETDGYTVYLARSDDTFAPKRSRARYCNSVNASVMVSVHHNSYDTDTGVDYSTALYYKDTDIALASSILEAVTDQLDTRNQGIAKFDNSMLYIATMPAVMSEGFFITNTSEYNQISKSNSARLTAEAEAIKTGIENYFANPDASAATTDINSLNIDRSDYDDE